MSKKTITLITSLVIVTVVLFAVALLSNNATPFKETAMKPTPTPFAQSILTFSPNPIEITATRTASVDVMLDTQNNNATAVQLEIAYDPTILTNFAIKPGPFFSHNQLPPDNIINTNDTKNGRITYALVLPLSQKPVKGTGVIATISFTQRAILPLTSGVAATTTELTLLPKSLVTAEGVSKSVLRQATGTKVMLYNPNAITPTTVRTTNPVVTTTPALPR